MDNWNPILANAARPAPAEAASNPGGATDPLRRIELHNRWREQFNPLRSLSMPQAVAWLEAGQRGEFADLQWAYSLIERRDADLLALVERRTGALVQMDWNIKTVEKRFSRTGRAFDKALADDQAAMLRERYDRFSNLSAAIEHLALASFRGYAHVQFAAEGALLRELQLLDQWNVLRDGLNGPWFWNPTSQARTAQGLPKEQQLNPAAYVIRTHKRPINEIALIKYLRHNLSAKDWDAFLEIYGIPGWVVIMPPNIPNGKEAEYEAAAQTVAEGGSGALPNGSAVECADSPRGMAPFRDHLQYWTERLVLAGTGGLLTMLTAPGSGTLAGSAHQEAFELLAQSEAQRISELFQASIDRALLAAEFPGRPAMAYFDIAAEEEQDVGQILDHTVKIAQAGGEVDWSQISEKTGYRITLKPAAPAPVFAPSGALANRAQPEANQQTVDAVLKAREKMLGPLLRELEAIDADTSLTPEQYLAKVEEAIKRVGALLTPEALSALAWPFEQSMRSAVETALQGAAKRVETAA